MLAWRTSKIPYQPAVVINNRTLRGRFDAENLFNAICVGFNDTVYECNYDVTQSSGMGVGTLFFLMLLIALIAGVIIYLNIRGNKRAV